MLVQGGRLIDPAQRLDRLFDLRIRGDVVAELGEHLQPERDEEVLDARSAYVAPGFIDMHVHLREPGNPEKETLRSGLSAAARGGFTAVAAMPNTNPAIDSPELVHRLCEQAASIGFARVYPIAAITQARAGKDLTDFDALASAGARAFSDDGNTVMDGRVMLRAAQAAARRSDGVPLIVHCEDERRKNGAVMTAGPAARKLGVPGAAPLCEDAMVARDVLVAAQTGCALHVAHVSTATAVDLVRFAKTAAGDGAIAVTCEVTPHHLVFTEADVLELGAAAKVNPPLRFAFDVGALRAAVRDGTVDAFASDHAPHTSAEKSGDLRRACVGFTGLEIAVGAYAHALPDLSLTRFVELLSTNPARILGVPGGTLRVGAPADVTVFADEPWRVDPAQFRSKGKCTPFAGMSLPRRALTTIVGGKIIRE